MPGGRSQPAPKRRMFDLRLATESSSRRRVVRGPGWAVGWEGRTLGWAEGGLLV